MRRFLLAALLAACVGIAFLACVDVVHLRLHRGPIVVGTLPADGELDVDRRSSVFVYFSTLAPLDEGSASVDTFRLRDGSSVLQGTLLVDSSSVSFKSSSPMRHLATFTATLSTSLRDARGFPAEQPYTWEFETADLQWTSPTIFSTTGGFARDIRVATAGTFQVAVWSQVDGTRTNIHGATRAGTGSAWSAPVVLDSEDLGDAGGASVDVNRSGDAIAVWGQSDGTRANVWAARYTVAGGWETAGLIETDNAGSAGTPRIAINDSGNGVAAWSQSNGTRMTPRAARYVKGSGWSGALSLESGVPQGETSDITLAIDPAGNAIVVWLQREPTGTAYNVWSNAYAFGGSWSGSWLVDTSSLPAATSPSVAFAPNGDAFAAWVQGIEGLAGRSVFAAWYRGGAWMNRFGVETDATGYSRATDVAVDGSGNAFVIWEHALSGGADPPDIWVRRADVSGSWGPEVALEDSPAVPARDPAIAVDHWGHATAVWRAPTPPDMRVSVVAARFRSDLGSWQPSTKIEQDDSGDCYVVSMDGDALGQAAASWQRDNGVQTDVFSAVFE